MAGSLDQVSLHVLASAVVNAATERKCKLLLPEGVDEVPGLGIRGMVSGHTVAVGKGGVGRCLRFPGVGESGQTQSQARRFAHGLREYRRAASRVLVFDDPLRPDTARTIRSLRHGGITRIVMMTGDRADVADTVGAVIGVDEVIADCTPEDKLRSVRLERIHGPTVMVGDGINDAPALAVADVGVAMGARGATASSEAADVVLTVDRLDRLGQATMLARRTRRIARQSVIAGMAMTLGAMGAAAVGRLPAVWGALLQEAIDVAVIMNALRALHGGDHGLRFAQGDEALIKRFQEEHVAIRGDLEQIRSAADALDNLEPREAIARVQRVYKLLIQEVGPHERAEEELFYPVLSHVLGGSDPTGPMSRAHVEIAHQTRRLGQVLNEIGPERPDEVDIAELRRILYGLHAIVRLHTAQEDESYLSLGDGPGASAEPVAST